ncbi:tetratricopeptide repeat protein [Segetibacter sp. 3557_3]|uniref:tetratricopeptide repeat-containing sensor histidine kinase n=1 Tax=Segetibacter sp. 3557_3 TaxID=2547429 RepID=UPI001405066E|nr:tetratricopeptide repeat protein [Segetibacter sp. 3557_3]
MKKALLFAFLFFCVSYSFPQHKTIDSLYKALHVHMEDTNKVNTLLHITRGILMQGDTAEAIRCAKEALSISNKLHYKRGEGRANRELGLIKMNQKQFQQALAHFQIAHDCFRAINDKDGLGQAMFSIGDTYAAMRNFSAAVNSYSVVLQHYKAVNNKRGIANTYRSIGDTYSAQQISPEALRNYYSALKLYEPLPDKMPLALCMSRIAREHQLQENHPLTINYYRQSLKLLEEVGNRVEIARVSNLLGTAYFVIGKYDDAMQAHLKALKIANEIKGIRWLLPMTHARLGGDVEALAQIAAAAGDTTTSNRLYSDALSYYGQALKSNREQGSKMGEADVNWHFGSIYTKLKKYQLARKHFQEALALYKEEHFKPFVALSYYSLSQLDSIDGNFRQAYEHFKAGKTYRDSTFNDETSRNAIKAKVEYEYIRKEDSLKTEQLLTAEMLKRQQLLTIQQRQRMQLQLASLSLTEQQKELNRLAYLRTQAELQVEQGQRQEREKQLIILANEKALEQANLKIKNHELLLKTEEVKAKSLERNVIVTTAVAILVLGIALWQNHRRRQIANNLLEKHKMRMQIASDLHDDVGSELSSISFYSEMARMNLAVENGTANNLLGKIGDNARNVINNMSDVVWLINPENDVSANLLKRMKLHAAEICSERGIAYRFTADDQIATANLDMRQRKNIYLIFKEAIHNAIKYADCNEIDITFYQGNHSLKMIVHDDGKGFDPMSAREGNGLSSMKRRATEINATIEIQSRRDSGTSIILKAKIT